MDRVAVEAQIDEITKLLSEMEDKKSREYRELSASLSNLQDALMRDLTYEQNRIKANMELDFKQTELETNRDLKMKEMEMNQEVKLKEIESRVDQEKVRGKWGLIGAIGAGVLGLGGVIFQCFSRQKNIESLRQIKNDQGIVDRDELNMANR